MQNLRGYGITPDVLDVINLIFSQSVHNLSEYLQKLETFIEYVEYGTGTAGKADYYEILYDNYRFKKKVWVPEDRNKYLIKIKSFIAAVIELEREGCIYLVEISLPRPLEFPPICKPKKATGPLPDNEILAILKSFLKYEIITLPYFSDYIRNNCTSRSQRENIYRRQTTLVTIGIAAGTLLIGGIITALISFGSAILSSITNQLLPITRQEQRVTDQNTDSVNSPSLMIRHQDTTQSR